MVPAARPPEPTAERRLLDVLVVGAGQAGLAAGHWLNQTALDYLLIDGAARVGDSWRRRWDSLTLFTPAAYSALPGLAMPGDPWAYPTRDQIADYLEAYARHFDLPMRLGSRVAWLERADGAFAATLRNGERITSRSVIVATGAFQVPAAPAMATGLADDVVQLGPGSYRSPPAVPQGTVLVVGDGATGRQIALDLAETHRVLLASGRPRRVIPERILGRSLFWWLDRLGLLRAPARSRIGSYLRQADPIPGNQLGLASLAGRGVDIRPRVVSMAGGEVAFADGGRSAVAAVVWAAGFRDDTSWIGVGGALDAQARVVETDGISPVPGLAYVGRSWQRSRGSALLCGVGDDARRVVEHLAHQAQLTKGGMT